MPAARQIYRGRVVDLRLEEVDLPTGVRVTLEIVRHPGAAAIVAVDDDMRVTLVRQFRHAAGGFLWEVPAGVLHPGEEPLECARRELREETGLVAADWAPLGSILTSPGFCDERIHLFLARRLTAAEQSLDHDEVLTPERLPLARALAMLHTDEIRDAKSVAALCRAAAVLAA